MRRDRFIRRRSRAAPSSSQGFSRTSIARGTDRVRPQHCKPGADQQPESALVEHVGRACHYSKGDKAQHDKRGRLLFVCERPFLRENIHCRNREGEESDQAKLGKEPDRRRVDQKWLIAPYVIQLIAKCPKAGTEDWVLNKQLETADNAEQPLLRRRDARDNLGRDSRRRI